ncbi:MULTISPECIES: glycine betaine/L-proline ABC transporter substrate-binding protein ProX [unclassified Roseofilum]|uniref:glycine betaine/L-proline ABC transporter substrate-binding protein ProX n=1 Tax=unclassified Roseofilum TaxID=2620099 RepID=UPI001B294979|nr:MULTISPECIES: glycine betaine/L-proline ABC transporter substrate-binding protein ProX [unclassified Roseofilum]MBP0008698.1 glycine betaine/L-proline ABC transporter substrate-binding protein ProX [Roseofilum sp. Belize Diploria]MBP0033107.1 glycine betaine/L-proline ABC transporter substrate-binding protein ProX [Roseofilum sp. Belize BBD 4]
MSLLLGLMSCQTTSEPSGSSGNLSLEEVTIRSGHSSWVEESFQTQIVNLGLEKLGYTIDPVKELEYPAVYLSVANGDLDYSVVYYQPGHNDFFKNAGGEEKLVGLGLLTTSGLQGYLIDKKTAEEYNISNLEQFQDPEIAKLFDFDGDGKANLTGCNPGWSCELTTNHHIEAYKLQDTVEHDQGSYTALLADAMTRYEEEEPIFYYTYNPHWISAVLKPGEDVIWLEVPFTSLPGDSSDLSEKDTTFEGKNLGLPANTQQVISNPMFLENNPVAKRWFELVQIPLEDMNEASLRIKEGENTAEDLRRMAQEWVSENQEQFDRWIEEAKGASE